MLKLIERFIIITNIFNIGSLIEIPLPHCANDKPFKLNNGFCANFNEICVKIGDQQCENFKTACQQCPPSNFSVIMFQDILYLKYQMNLKMDRFNEHLINSKIQIKKSADLNIYISIAITILLLLNILFLFLEIKFKLITKFFYIQLKSKILDSLANRIEDDMVRLTQYSKIIDSLDDRIKDEMVRLTQYSNQMESLNMDEIRRLILNSKIDSYKIKFRILKQMIDLELRINDNDNIVKLKQIISDRIKGIYPNDYKTIKMKYKGNLLDNNKYLLSCIDSSEIPICCEYDNDNDNNNNIKEIIILKLMANFSVPEMLEIKLSETIKQLKNIISQITQSRIEDLIIMKQSDKLDNNKTVEQCGLSDNDWIEVIKITNGTVRIQSIFHDNIQYEFKYCSTDTVLSLKEKLADKLQCEAANLSLFTNLVYLLPNNYLYKYYFSGDLLIKYLNITDPNKYEQTYPILERGNIKYFIGKHKITQEKILIKTYSSSIFENEGNIIDWISKKLRLFMITKSHSRFIQLLNVYLCNNMIYLAIENMKGMSLKIFIENEQNWPVHEYQIAKWANQILEGLAYINQYGIVYMDLNPGNIFIDGNHNVKLPSFKWTGYFKESKIDKFTSDLSESIVKYISPEIIRGQSFSIKSDVWSLGMLLIKMYTGEHPFINIKENEYLEIIRQPKLIMSTSACKMENASNELKAFFNLCYLEQMNERASIDDLFQTEFIRTHRNK